MKDFDLASVSKWAEHLHPGALEWVCEEGRVSGVWSLTPNQGYGAGELKIQDLTLSSVNNPFVIHIPAVSTARVNDGTTIYVENKGKMELEWIEIS